MHKSHGKDLRPSPSDASEAYLNRNTWLPWLEKNKPSLYKKVMKPTNQAELAKLLLGWRLVFGLTQQGVAHKAGLSMATYQKLEGAGEDSNPNYLTLCNIAKVYEVGIKDFWEGPR